MIFQNKGYTKKQLQYITTQCNGQEDIQKLAKMVFGDNDTNKTRSGGGDRKWFSPQSAVMGEYDRSFTYGITIAFNSPTPNFQNFKVLMDQQFNELQSHLIKGGDIVIPKALQQDINKNRKKYFKDGQQKIFHNIGTDKTILPFNFMEYIQQKIGELRNYARDIITVDYYGNYQPSNDNSDEKSPRARGRGRGRRERGRGRGRGRGGRGRGRGGGRGGRGRDAKYLVIFHHNEQVYNFSINDETEKWDDKLFEAMKKAISRKFNIEDTFEIETQESKLDIDDIGCIKDEFDSLEEGNTIHLILKDVTPKAYNQANINNISGRGRGRGGRGRGNRGRGRGREGSGREGVRQYENKAARGRERGRGRGRGYDKRGGRGRGRGYDNRGGRGRGYDNRGGGAVRGRGGGGGRGRGYDNARGRDGGRGRRGRGGRGGRGRGNDKQRPEKVHGRYQGNNNRQSQRQQRPNKASSSNANLNRSKSYDHQLTANRKLHQSNSSKPKSVSGRYAANNNSVKFFIYILCTCFSLFIYN